jgi:Zn-dependent M28 family amino/carboxypeptidase
MKKTLAFMLALLVGNKLMVAQNNTTFDTKNITTHIAVLAHDSLEGRGTATAGGKKAAVYIAQQFEKIGLEKIKNLSYLHNYTFSQQSNPHAQTADSSKDKKIEAQNVVGFINNNKAHTIVIGAHYDHLGIGKSMYSLDAHAEGKIHNGADDNASGVAGVIELARFYKNIKNSNYNFLFVCFSGEELGLYGSKMFVENAPIELSNINVMINMDMIGRLNDSTKKIMIYGVGTSPFFVETIKKIESTLQVSTDSSGIGPSDQTSFYLKNIPVLHYFTGQHSDYHKPSDDIEKINVNGVALVLTHITTMIEKINDVPKLTFLKTRDSNKDNNTKFKVTLGIMPDYMYDGKGVKADGVSDGKPASKAGIKAGDVIIELGTYAVGNMQEYMKALSEFKKGDKTSVKILRKNEEIILNIEF